MKDRNVVFSFSGEMQPAALTMDKMKRRYLEDQVVRGTASEWMAGPLEKQSQLKIWILVEMESP